MRLEEKRIAVPEPVNANIEHSKIRLKQVHIS